jgi:hypothetical protein
VRWRQFISLVGILISATALIASCENGLRPDPNSFDFINMRRDN